MTVLSEPDRVGSVELSNIDRIRHAALKILATHGASGTSLRAVAAAAGVSLGLVQHHFATKAGLINAVDDYALAVVVTAITQPVPDTTPDSVAEIGGRVTRMIAEHPDIADYVGRALIDGRPVADMIFDSLLNSGHSTLATAQRARRDTRWPRSDLGRHQCPGTGSWHLDPAHAHRPAPARAVHDARSASTMAGLGQHAAARWTVPSGNEGPSNPLAGNPFAVGATVSRRRTG